MPMGMPMGMPMCAPMGMCIPDSPMCMCMCIPMAAGSDMPHCSSLRRLALAWRGLEQLGVRGLG